MKIQGASSFSECMSSPSVPSAVYSVQSECKTIRSNSFALLHATSNRRWCPSVVLNNCNLWSGIYRPSHHGAHEITAVTSSLLSSGILSKTELDSYCTISFFPLYKVINWSCCIIPTWLLQMQCFCNSTSESVLPLHELFRISSKKMQQNITFSYARWSWLIPHFNFDPRNDRGDKSRDLPNFYAQQMSQRKGGPERQ